MPPNTALFTKLVSDTLRSWLQTYLPAHITALNGQSPTAYGGADGNTTIALTLDPIASWSDHASVANVATPAVYLLPQMSGLRSPAQRSNLDEQHEFAIAIEVGDPDQGVAHAKLLYYVAAVVRLCVGALQGTDPVGNGCQVMLGHEGAELLVQWGLTPSTTTPSGLYEFATIAITVFVSETP